MKRINIEKAHVFGLVYGDYDEYETYAYDEDRRVPQKDFEEASKLYEVISKPKIQAGGDIYNFVDLENTMIVKRLSDGVFIRISWTHDSWSEEGPVSNDYDAVEVKAVEKTITVYE